MHKQQELGCGRLGDTQFLKQYYVMFETYMKAKPSGWQVFALGHPWVLPPSQNIWPSPQVTGVGVLQSVNC